MVWQQQRFLPPNNNLFLSAREVAERYDVSLATIWRWPDSLPNFPKPVRLSPGCTRWRLSELERFEAQLGRGK